MHLEKPINYIVITLYYENLPSVLRLTFKGQKADICLYLRCEGGWSWLLVIAK